MNFVIGQAAVLGAGVMGTQIAALLATAGIPTYLFDLSSNKGAPNALAQSSIAALKQLKPQALATEQVAQWIIAANYAQHLPKLLNCDLIIEAISERLDWKQALYRQIIPFIGSNSILITATAGLSIQALAQELPLWLQSRFCGIHFFNPVRYKKLVELVPHSQTNLKLLQYLETWLVAKLGKGVVYAQDVPHFIANRIGIFALLRALSHSARLGIAPEVVDTLLGQIIGDAALTTFRGLDQIGLDSFKEMVQHFTKLLQDPWQEHLAVPTWINDLLMRGALGDKTQGGVYIIIGGVRHVWEASEQQYRHCKFKPDPSILLHLKKTNFIDKWQVLRTHAHPHAQFLWHWLRDVLHYAAYHLASIGHSVEDIDLAMRWGYAWQMGPFEIWQAVGWQHLLTGLMAPAHPLPHVLPKWCHQLSDVYTEQGAYSPIEQTYIQTTPLAVYARQYLTQRKIFKPSSAQRRICLEHPLLQLWTLSDPKIGILTIKTANNLFQYELIEALNIALQQAEQQFNALIIYPDPVKDFSLGADVAQLFELLWAMRYDLLAQGIHALQTTLLKFKYAKLPIISAVQGKAWGIGCELVMHTSAQVATMESYMGLVEPKLGLISVGGGIPQLARQMVNGLDKSWSKSQLLFYFKQLFYAITTGSGQQAKKSGYLAPETPIILNEQELLFHATKLASFYSDLTFQSQLPQKFPVAGRMGIAYLQAYLVNLREAGQISDHRYEVGCKIAQVLCGGSVESNTWVDEAWMNQLACEAFMELAKQERTHHLLQRYVKTQLFTSF